MHHLAVLQLLDWQLDKELFITTQKSMDLEVYDSTTYSFKRLLRVPELNDPWDMTCAPVLDPVAFTSQMAASAMDICDST